MLCCDFLYKQMKYHNSNAMMHPSNVHFLYIFFWTISKLMKKATNAKTVKFLSLSF